MDATPPILPMWVFYVLGVCTLGLFVQAIFSAIAAARGQWEQSKRRARYATAGSAGVLLLAALIIFLPLVFGLYPGEGPSKATVLAATISELMNVTVLAPPTMFLGAFLWVLSAMRLRSQKARSN